MKRLLIFLACGLSVFLPGGCQSSCADKTGVKVIIEGDGQFPEFLVGTWKANTHGWEIVFEPDGTISSAVISLGRVRMKPGEVTTVPMKMDGKGVFEPGPWLVHYVPDKRELTVVISLRNLYVEVGDNVLEGNSKDVLAGTISQHGDIWQADWTSFPKYTAHTDVYSNFDLSEDPNYGITNALIFEKVTGE